MPTRATSHDESLAAVQDGESIEILYILFDSLRAFGEARGVRNGSRLRCRASGASTLVLESETGDTVLFPRDLARFVRVRRSVDVESNSVRPAHRGGEPDYRPSFREGGSRRQAGGPRWG